MSDVRPSLMLRQTFLEEVFKTFQASRKRKPRLDGRKRLSRVAPRIRPIRRKRKKLQKRHKDRISCVTGRIYTFCVKHRGPSEPDHYKEMLVSEVLLEPQAKYNRPRAAD
ncbi:uncharacterized protein V6R79_005207 [Siganus canaliculatus]